MNPTQAGEAVKIVSAAIMVRGMTVSMPKPFRHHHIVHRYAEANGKDYFHDQGFITSKGDFVDRHTAFLIAHKAGQIKPRVAGNYDGDELFSEDLW